MSLSTKSRPSSRSVTVKAVQQESERLWRKGFVKEMSFKSGIKGRGSDSSTENQLLFERAKLGGGLWWGDAQDEVDQEESEQNIDVDGMKKGADSRGKVMHIY